MEYDWQLALGDEPLSRQEFQALARLKQPLVQVRGRWVELRPEQLQQALAYFEKQGPGGQMPLLERGRAGAGARTARPAPDRRGERRGAGSRRSARVTGWRGARRGGRASRVPWARCGRISGRASAGWRRCAATAWAPAWPTTWAWARRSRSSRCCCSADGGGRRAPTLLVCPTSVVGNWQREVARFAPASGAASTTAPGAPTATTFGGQAARARRGASRPTRCCTATGAAGRASTGTGWSWTRRRTSRTPRRRPAQAARALPARLARGAHRHAGGEPAGGAVGIFEFLNPGYLGTAERFRERFALPIERERRRGGRGAAAPTGRARSCCGGSRATARSSGPAREAGDEGLLHADARAGDAVPGGRATSCWSEVDEAEGIQRRGQVLAALTRLKQICNHPALFLHDGSALRRAQRQAGAADGDAGGGPGRGDRALVFTQFARDGRRCSQEHLHEHFGGEVLFLHGGTPTRQRDAMVHGSRPSRDGPRAVRAVAEGGRHRPQPDRAPTTSSTSTAGGTRPWRTRPPTAPSASASAQRAGPQARLRGTFEETMDQLIERKTDAGRERRRQRAKGGSRSCRRPSCATCSRCGATRWETTDGPRTPRVGALRRARTVVAGIRARATPANGIKAQTQRGAFGKSWWAGRWIAALERLVDAAGSGAAGRTRVAARC